MSCMAERTIAIIVLLAGLAVLSPSARAESFDIRIKNRGNYVYQALCHERIGVENWYSTGTKTTTTDIRWACATAGDCETNTWRLQFHRNTYNTAEGGQCTTADSTHITGDGIFTARLYIHSNV